MGLGSVGTRTALLGTECIPRDLESEHTIPQQEPISFGVVMKEVEEATIVPGNTRYMISLNQIGLLYKVLGLMVSMFRLVHKVELAQEQLMSVLVTSDYIMKLDWKLRLIGGWLVSTEAGATLELRLSRESDL